MPQAASARASNTTNQNQYSNQFHSYPQQNNQQVYGNATSSSSHDIADHRDDAQLKAQTRDMDAQNQAFLDAFNDSKAPPGLSQDQLVGGGGVRRVIWYDGTMFQEDVDTDTDKIPLRNRMLLQFVFPINLFFGVYSV